MPVVVMVAITLILHPLLIIWDMVRTGAKLVKLAMLEVLVSWSSDTVTCVLHVQLGLMRQLGAQFCQIALATQVGLARAETIVCRVSLESTKLLLELKYVKIVQ